MTRLIHAVAALLSAMSIVDAACAQSNPAPPAAVQSDLREAGLGEADAVQADPVCGDLDACYRTAQSARAEGLFVRYVPANNSQTQIDVLGCDYRVGRCSVQTASPGPNILRDFKWSLPLGLPGQGLQYGQHPTAVPASVDANPKVGGYATLPRDLPLLQGDLNWTRGFTVVATGHVDAHSAPATLWSILGEDGAPLFSLVWAGRFQLQRRATVASGQAPAMMTDVPWDLTLDGLQLGVPPFRDQAPDRHAGLYEIYLTFRPDGKVRVDLFSVRETGRDRLIQHLQDPGAPVLGYPRQSQDPSANPRWLPARYPTAARLQAGSVAGVRPDLLQVMLFQRPLSADEILAYHRMNLFFGGTKKASTIDLRAGQLPCNTGAYIMSPSTEHVATVCGPRAGIR